jgi:hypothetical protein
MVPKAVVVEPGAGSVVPAKPKHPGGPFKQGHPKLGGRSKGTPNKKLKRAQELAQQYPLDPVEFLLMVVNAETLDEPETDKDGRVIVDPVTGKPVMKKVPVPREMRIDAAKAVAPYVHPKLLAQQLTGVNDGPVQFELPTGEILKNAKLTEALSDLALMVAENGAAALDE